MNTPKWMKESQKLMERSNWSYDPEWQLKQNDAVQSGSHVIKNGQLVDANWKPKLKEEEK